MPEGLRCCSSTSFTPPRRVGTSFTGPLQATARASPLLLGASQVAQMAHSNRDFPSMKAATLSSPTLTFCFCLCAQAASWLPFARLLASGEVKANSPEGVSASTGTLTSRYTITGQRAARMRLARTGGETSSARIDIWGETYGLKKIESLAFSWERILATISQGAKLQFDARGGSLFADMVLTNISL